MALPQAVQRADKRADEWIAAYQQQLEQGKTGNDDPEGTPTQAASEPPATPAEPPPAPSPATPPPTNPDEYQQLAQAHRVLQGKYSAEVPRMAEEIRTLREHASALTKHLETLQQQQAAPPIPATNDDVLEGYDEDLRNYLASMNQRVRQAETQNVELKKMLDAQSGSLSNVEQVTTRSLRDQFIQSLTGAVPNWEQVNVDPAFVAWLQTTHPMANQTYQDMLTSAHQAWDAQRAAMIFQEYQRQHTAQNPGNQPPITPTASSAAPTAAPSDERRVWTDSEVRAFYDEARKPQPKYSPEALQHKEREIEVAAAEGRIRPG